MTKEPACGNTPALSRRTFLTALPASGAAFALPVAVQAGQTEILRLFHRHQAIMEAARTHVCISAVKDEDDELEYLFYRHTDRLEEEMMTLPVTCAADLAAKMIVAHCGGEFTCLSFDDAVWIEARLLTGSA
jgi:hypothetical protein